MAAGSAERAILFGPFRLFPTQRLLLEGDRPVRLGNRALDVLIALIARPGELIGKDELVARVWPDTCLDGLRRNPAEKPRRSLTKVVSARETPHAVFEQADSMLDRGAAQPAASRRSHPHTIP